jgi:hypothetical protein
MGLPLVRRQFRWENVHPLVKTRRAWARMFQK